MAVKFDVDVKVALDIEQRLEEMEERLGNLEPILKKQAVGLDALIQRSFQKSESPLGEAFVGLKHRDGKPLLDTGLFRRSVSVRPSRLGIKFGASGPRAAIAAFHTLGTKHIPRRSVFPVDQNGNVDFSTGRAKKWHDRFKRKVMEWVLSGNKAEQ